MLVLAPVLVAMTHAAAAAARCDAALAQACGGLSVRTASNCDLCAAAHQHALRSAGCSERDFATFCNGSPPAASLITASCTNAADCTVELQAALDSCARTVHVPSLPDGRSWVVRPVSVTCDGQTIDFGASTVLQGMRGQFHKHGAGGMLLFRIQNRSGVTVRGNGGATFRMWREDYGNPKLYNHSEGRHGVAIYGSRNIVLDGLTVTETGGDGVYVSNILGQVGTPNRNVSVLNCNLTGNYRNAMSVISVSGLRVENTTLALSQGTPPEGGIDMEPNSPENLLQDIHLENVTMFGNTQRSLTLSAHALQAAYTPVSITVRNTRIAGGSFGVSINNGKKGLPPGSSMVLDGLVVSNTSGSGLLLEDKSENLDVSIRNSVFRSVATQNGHPVPIIGGVLCYTQSWVLLRARNVDGSRCYPHTMCAHD
jgi:hypothetical protein